MSQATVAVLASFHSQTAGSVHRLVHGGNNGSHSDLIGRLAQQISAAGTAHAAHQVIFTQTGEQLFKVGKGYPLTLGYFRQRHRPLMGMQGDIKHGGYRITTFGSKSHGNSSRLVN